MRVFLVLWISLAAGLAHAQEQPEETPQDPPAEVERPTFPILQRSVSVSLPDGTLEAGGPAREVLVTIAIGADGAVSDAQLVATTGDEVLDAAALQVAKALTFYPSTLAGEPIAVTIDYPVVFIPPPLPAPEVVPASLKGRIEVKGSLEPVELIDVVLYAATRREDAKPLPDPDSKKKPKPLAAEDYDLAEEPTASFTTPADGTFDLGDFPAGTYVIAVGSGGYKLQKWVEVLGEGVVREVVYRISPTGVPETVVVARRESDTPERVLTRDELRKMPGAGSDPLAALSALPGVVHTPASFGGGADAQAPVLRGASAEDSVLYLDGLPVPIIFHSISNFSITGDYLVDEAFLKPAATEARYGDLTGGVVGLDLRSPRNDRVGGFLDPGIGLFAFALEGPITKKSRFYVGLRRSNFELLFGAIFAAANIDFAVAPYFQDQQIILEADPTDWLTLSLGYIGTLDGIKLLDDEPDEDDPDPLIFSLLTDMHRIRLKADMEAPFGLTNKAQAALTFWGTEFRFTDVINITDKHTTVHVVDDVFVPIFPWLELNGGALLEVDSLDQTRITPIVVREDGGARDTIGSEEPLSGRQDEVRTWVGGYIGATLKPHSTVSITPEVRFDYFSSIDEIVPQVRGRIGLQPIDQLRFSVAGGRYVQSPSLEELNETTGNPELGAEGAWHVNGGVKITPGPWLTVDVQGYYKHLDNQVVTSNQASSFSGFADFSGLVEDEEEDPTHGLSNSGAGRIYGMELFARFGFLRGVGITGWLGYSLSWAERKDFADEDWRWFQHDRRHAVTALIQLALPGEVSFGARFQYQTGAPTTPIDDSTYYADAGFWVPEYGGLYTARGKPFHQLDLRLGKIVRHPKHKDEIYIDVQNIYASTNGDFAIPSYDYREEFAFTNIPSINFGVRVEF